LYQKEIVFATIVVSWLGQEILPEGICIIEPIQIFWYKTSLATQSSRDYPADPCEGHKERIKL